MNPTLKCIWARKNCLFSFRLACLLLPVVLSGLATIETYANENPLRGTRQIRFIEEWRLDCEDERYLIGLPTDVIRIGDEILILDQQMNAVWVFGDDGNYKRKIGREGDGPGDLRGVVALVDLGAKGIGILERSPARLCFFDIMGMEKGALRIGDGKSILTAYNIEGSDRFCVILASQVNPIRQNNRAGSISTTSLLRLDTDTCEEVLFELGQREFYYYGNSSQTAEEDQYVFSGYTVIGNQLFVANDRNQYKIAVLGARGDSICTIDRKYESRKRSKKEIDIVVAERSQSLDGTLQIQFAASDYNQDIEAIRSDGKDELWVLSSRGARDLPDQVYEAWEVFNTSGVFLERVEIVLETDRDRDKIFWLDDGSAILCQNWASAQNTYYGGHVREDVSIVESDQDKGSTLEVILLSSK